MIKNKIKEYLFNTDFEDGAEAEFYKTAWEDGHCYVIESTIDWEQIYIYRFNKILDNFDIYINKPCALSDAKIKKAIIKYVSKLNDKYKLDLEYVIKNELKELGE